MTDWQPGTDLATLGARAALKARIRRFFADRDVLEVDTPAIARYPVTDPALEPLILDLPEGEPRYLQTSPEFAMKRLLAAGSGPIYELGRAFRAGESGARHNPEFLLLEWYRPGFTLQALMDEVADLVHACRDAPPAPVSHWRYGALFQDRVGLDPHSARTSDLAAAAAEATDTAGLNLDRDGWLDLLMSHVVEPSLRNAGLVFIRDYPESQAALARCRERDGVTVADRFELYLDGVEVANGYRELLEASVLRERAQRDNRRRSHSGQAMRVLDPRLVGALEAGLPDCSGVALGVDRLLMARLGASQMDAIMPFAWSRC